MSEFDVCGLRYHVVKQHEENYMTVLLQSPSACALIPTLFLSCHPELEKVFRHDILLPPLQLIDIPPRIKPPPTKPISLLLRQPDAKCTTNIHVVDKYYLIISSFLLPHQKRSKGKWTYSSPTPYLPVTHTSPYPSSHSLAESQTP